MGRGEGRGGVGEPGFQAKSPPGSSAATSAAPEILAGVAVKVDGGKGEGRRDPAWGRGGGGSKETGAIQDVSTHVEDLFRSIQTSEEERKAQAAVREARQARHARLLGSWGFVLGGGCVMRHTPLLHIYCLLEFVCCWGGGCHS